MKVSQILPKTGKVILQCSQCNKSFIIYMKKGKITCPICGLNSHSRFTFDHEKPRN